VAEPAAQAADLGEGAQQHGAHLGGEVRGGVDAVGRDMGESLGQELVMSSV
jgi:hypothetical protein